MEVLNFYILIPLTKLLTQLILDAIVAAFSEYCTLKSKESMWQFSDSRDVKIVSLSSHGTLYLLNAAQRRKYFLISRKGDFHLTNILITFKVYCILPNMQIWKYNNEVDEV